MSPTRVLLVDDHTIVRTGLAGLLSREPTLSVVGEAGDVPSAIDRLVRDDVDVVLLDVRLGAASGFDIVRGARARGSRAAFIVLTTFDDDATFGEALAVGAKGYLLKDTSVEDLVGAIRAVASGRTAFRPGMTERARDRVTTSETALVVEKPTAREREILRLLAAGFSNREIGESLGVAEGTVKNHVSSLLTKLGVRDRTRAVLRAIELRWL